MLSLERLRQVLDYDSEKGEFVWKQRVSIRIMVGDKAGHPLLNGYIGIGIDGKKYLAHRLAWFWVYGEWPPGIIDHINRDKTDNKLSNLRVCSKSENAANSKRRSDNTSGFKGVFFNKNLGVWTAKVQKNGRIFYVGSFNSASDAAAAYQSNAQRAFGEFASL